MKSLIVLALLCTISAAMLIPKAQRNSPWAPNVEFEEMPEETANNAVESQEVTSAEEVEDTPEEKTELETSEDQVAGKPSGFNVKPWKREQRWMRKHHRGTQRSEKKCSLHELLSKFSDDDRLALFDILKNEELSGKEKNEEIKKYGEDTENQEAIEKLLIELEARREQHVTDRRTAMAEVTEAFEEIEDIKGDLDLTKAEQYEKIQKILEEVGPLGQSMLRVLYGKHGHHEGHKKHFKHHFGKRNIHKQMRRHAGRRERSIDE